MISSPAIFAPTKYLNAREKRRVSRYFLAFLCTYFVKIRKQITYNNNRRAAQQRRRAGATDDNDDGGGSISRSCKSRWRSAQLFLLFSMSPCAGAHTDTHTRSHARTVAALCACACVSVSVLYVLLSRCVAGCVGVLRF